jgi:cephalosporin hydroxylase
MAFASRWLGVGAVQIPEEIEGALGYINSELPRRVCEIGTEDGGTTFLLSHMLPSVEMIIGIDLFVQNRPQLNLLHRSNQRLILINGSSYSSRIVRSVEKVLNGTSLDVLLIDGDHRYEGVKRDFLMYKHLVRENGFILFHDVIQDHAALYGKVTPAYSGGVPILWEELKRIYPSREFVRDPEQNGMGIGIIRYSSSVELPAWFTRKV